MWHSDPSRLHGMLELFVAPNMRNLIPAVLLQELDDFSAGHRIRYDTHFLHTCQEGVYKSYKSATGAYIEDGKGIEVCGAISS